MYSPLLSLLLVLATAMPVVQAPDLDASSARLNLDARSAQSFLASGRFVDDDGNPHEPDIEALAAANITKGCNPPSNDRFCPDEPVSRAAMAAFIARAMGEEPGEGASHLGLFSDVPADQWFTASIERMAQLGIANGYGDGTFRPHDLVSRGEMAALILRAIGEQSPTSASGIFDDVPASAWFAPWTELLYDLDITSGCSLSPLQYCPFDAVRRDHMATFIVRAFDLQAAGPNLGGVRVGVGDDVQAMVDDHPAGTTFVLSAGVYQNLTIAPRDRNRFIGEPGAILDGGGVTEHAIAGPGDDVTINGFLVRNYTECAFRSIMEGTDWLVDGNEFVDNECAIRTTDGWTVRNNNIHHQTQYGLLGQGDRVLVEGNEIAYNNTDNNSWWDAGGTKFVQTTNLILRANNVHHNNGHGLWTDGDNIDILFEDNHVWNNTGVGIFHEIGYDAVIRNNTVDGNGFDSTRWLDGAGILVHSSSNVEVYGNLVRNNNDGIAGVQTDRGSGKYGARELRNLHVHDNTIVMNSGHTGIVTNLTDAVFTSRNNRFDNNTYTVTHTDQPFRWIGGNDITWNQWQSHGQDTTGTYTPG